MADSRRRQAQPACSTRDMTFFQNDAEEHEEIQIDPG
ncbi:hypothetical protein GGD61_007512 [Bradyrhizobium sp. SBR1B]|nr:hypothetical protein [Bradyrhizobium sp. SBR1B]